MAESIASQLFRSVRGEQLLRGFNGDLQNPSVREYFAWNVSRLYCNTKIVSKMFEN